MDEISLLRRARTDIPERTPDEISRRRAALFAAIEDKSPLAVVDQQTGNAPTRTKPIRRRRRAAAWTGFSVLGATALTVTLVAVNVMGVPGVDVGGAQPAAASVLESAATAALQFSDPVVGAGQYLRVQTDAVYLAQGSISAEAETTGFLENSHEELYVPADREDDWVWVQCMRTPAQTFGPESEAFAESQRGAGGDIQRSFPGGITPSGGAVAGYNTGTQTTVDYAALPQDPEQLLQKIYELNEAALPGDQALAWIIETLMSGTVPAEFRAVLYETAALIPGVSITENQATLNGVTGVAVGRVEPERNERQDLIIDPTTGQFIGQRIVLLDGIGTYVPPGTVMASTAVTTTVVDTAPADASLCSNHR
jgi:RNA polymerase sigma-70 factor (ECF subfamily)